MKHSKTKTTISLIIKIQNSEMVNKLLSHRDKTGRINTNPYKKQHHNY